MNLPPLGNNTTLKLILTLTILAAGGGLIGGTVANASSLTENPSSFTAGTLVLSNTVESNLPCLSSAGNLKCDRVIDASLRGGQVVSSRVSLQNIGTVPVDNLRFWVGDCRSADASDSVFHGTGDLCPATQVTVHDDIHDFCYYPAAAPGPCSFAAGATVSDLVAKHTRGTPVTLSPDHLGGGITYTVSMRLDAVLGNDLQGRQASLDFVWHAGQGGA